MPEPRTIDNLGLGPSVRWAQDQEYVDQSIIKESSFVSMQTTVDVATPFYLSEFDLLFQITQRYAPWASFLSPKGYNLQKMRLFTHQVIPSLGSEEFLTSQVQKIRDKSASSRKERNKRRKEGRGSEYPWEDDRDDREEERESKTLIDLLEYINVLDTLMMQINARRSQYSKG
ncbi:MAG: hypothetical protein K1060chlam2_00739 [Chlamydiae bacterium]|nr:hypothetical protein [Chlamydiota bacterium]